MLITFLASLGGAAFPQIPAFGVGSQSCSSAFPAEREASAYAWVLGYLSGVNSGSGLGVGRTTDGDGIMAEVQLLCLRQPILPLFDAAEEIYIGTRSEGR